MVGGFGACRLIGCALWICLWRVWWFKVNCWGCCYCCYLGLLLCGLFTGLAFRFVCCVDLLRCIGDDW